MSLGFRLASVCVLAVFLLWVPSRSSAADDIEVNIGYISQLAERPPNLSNLILPPADEGVAGGRLSINDNNTTGRFLGHHYKLVEANLTIEEDVTAAFEKLYEDGVRYFALNLPADNLLKLADFASDRQVFLFNVGSADDRLRNDDCRDNVMHIPPSRSMLTDALAQFLIWKKWRRWFLIVGQMEGDRLYAEALRKSAKKFGAEIVADRAWAFGPDSRRTAQAEVPAFTQVEEHDVLVIADEIGVFGEYVMYRSWTPRPVVGTQGLTPTSWHRTHERWGAAQLQSRFYKKNKRYMTALDYQVWASIRAVGEAVTRTNSGDYQKIKDYLRGDQFELAGFKGLPLTFRHWNWQLRQPILLAHQAALVSVSPQSGFLHRRSVLDTMGLDDPESACQLSR